MLIDAVLEGVFAPVLFIFKTALNKLVKTLPITEFVANPGLNFTSATQAVLERALEIHQQIGKAYPNRLLVRFPKFFWPDRPKTSGYVRSISHVNVA
jgi:hypothetical protein